MNVAKHTIFDTTSSLARVTAQGLVEVSAQWVHENQGPGLRLVDVRGRDEFYGGLRHVPGAELVPLGLLEEQARGWDRHAPIITICRSGGRSLLAAGLLEAMGFDHVASMAGGMMSWNASGFPTE